MTLYTTTNILSALHWVLGISGSQSLRVSEARDCRPSFFCEGDSVWDVAAAPAATPPGIQRNVVLGRQADRAREKSPRRVRCV